ETLNLPKTEFPMRGNLAKKEPEIQKHWEEISLYDLIQEERANELLFILHDGPPYANGDIHVGTAYNKILKDIVLKYKSQRKHLCPYVPGWDCHGLPIEHEVTKRLGDLRRFDVPEIRAKCREHALEFVEKQAGQFKRLGVLGDFEDPYLTLSPYYEAKNIEVFGRLYEKGLVYKGRKPIHWCTHCVTALAEAEIEYEEEVSDSIYVKFPVIKGTGDIEEFEKPVSFLIWTTTPWTLPANVAVALSDTLSYAAVDTGDEILIMADDLVHPVTEVIGMKDVQIVKNDLRGEALEGTTCKHPWAERESRVVLADYVTLDQGTGCVHTAPGHGQEDYMTGLAYDLPSPMPVDDHGRFTREAAPFDGMLVTEANPEIIKDLKSKGLLMASGTIPHPYPHCWRCKRPVIFRATPQWFISVDKIDESESLRDEAIESLKQVEWIPGWTINRIGSMLEARPDWCISRQRSWGVPLPVLYCESCEKEMITDQTLESIKSFIEENGADAWFTHDAKEIVPECPACVECGGTSFKKDENILDVWFESGISNIAVLQHRSELEWPADLYVEGSDQHRGWFQSSLLLSMGYQEKPPYRAVMTHGFTVDGEGRKMSKSLGNVIDPKEVYSHMGADILRLWTATSDYSTDVPISDEILDRMKETYRRIRNTIRFLLGNTFDFDPQKDSVPLEKMEEIDRYILSRLQGLIQKVTMLMDKWVIHQAIQALHLFCTVDLSSFYLDIMKDRLYTFGADSRERRSTQTAMYLILTNLMSLIAPVLCHTAEEAMLSLPEAQRPKKSIHLVDWPKPDEDLIDSALEEKWSTLLALREDIYKRIEEERKKGSIGTSLEADVKIYADGGALELLKDMIGELPMLFIVSKVEVKGLSEYQETRNTDSDVEVEVLRAGGEKCNRCWNYSETVGELADYPDVCVRCAGVLETIGH
ncbi:MAG: isoleucine--tRNA ligase, partial [Actinobacteria bacterium]|nr:isoleucine--tRNA ligase [Actinomycetota bacterium]